MTFIKKSISNNFNSFKMEDKHYLHEDGKEKLKKALEASDEPLQLIDSLQVCDHFDFTPFNPLFQLGEVSNFDVSSILEKFIFEQKNQLIEKIKIMSAYELNCFFRTLQPYTMIPAFHDVIKYILDKTKRIPDWFIIPEDLKVEMTPAERLRMFKDRPSDFQEWLPTVFEESLCDFEDGDNFNYIKLFKTVARYCFQHQDLHKIAIDYCEQKFLEDYHPMYSVTRFRLALFNSPLAKIDPARPLSILVMKAIQDKDHADFHSMIKAAEICPRIAQIIFSVPNFMIQFRMISYTLGFGVTKELKQIWAPYLNSGNDEACEYMKDTPFFARVIAVNAAQGVIIKEKLFETLEFCQPQVDVNYIFCRLKYDTKYENLLLKWASLNGACFIDYITSCLSRGVQIPQFETIPQLSVQQQEIYEYIKDSQRQEN